MTTLFMLGALQIQIAPFNIDAISESGETEYAVKSVVGTEPLLEFVGEGANTMSLSGRLFPYELGGLDELGLLQQMRASGKPQYVMRGDGQPYGWFAILDVQVRSSYLGRQGIGKQIDVSIGLRRAPKPSGASFFSLMQGLLS